MTGEQADLSAVGVEVPEPLLERKWPLYLRFEPDDPREETETRLAGFICWMHHRRMHCYSSWRTSYHYYREGEGYAVSAELLARARGHDAKRVVIHEAENHGDDVWEYGMDQWFDADFIEEGHLADSDDPQRYLPTDEAMYEWDGHAPDLFVRDFDAAREHIIDQRGWPNV